MKYTIEKKEKLYNFSYLTFEANSKSEALKMARESIEFEPSDSQYVGNGSFRVIKEPSTD